MLHQITWQQYLLFTAAVLLLYYAMIWLVFFRQQPTDLTNGRQSLKPQPETDEFSDDDLLGEAAEEYGVSTLESDELFFGPNDTEEEPALTGMEEAVNFETEEDQGEQEQPLSGTGTAEELLQADLPDLLEDVKAVFHFIRVHEPEARDLFVSKVVSAVVFYKRVIGSDLLPMILTDISERALSELGFEVSAEELNDQLIRSRDLKKATFGAKY